MIRNGKVCAHCDAGKCHDKPGELDPLEIACPACGEKGCKACRWQGWISIPMCPQKWLDNDTHELVRFSELFRKGIPPVNGGALDQTKWFLEAERFYRSECELHRADGSLDMDALNDG